MVGGGRYPFYHRVGGGSSFSLPPSLHPWRELLSTSLKNGQTKKSAVAKRNKALHGGPNRQETETAYGNHQRLSDSERLKKEVLNVTPVPRPWCQPKREYMVSHTFGESQGAGLRASLLIVLGDAFYPLPQHPMWWWWTLRHRPACRKSNRSDTRERQRLGLSLSPTLPHALVAAP